MDGKRKCSKLTNNMGTFSNNTIQDLKVTIKESTLIFPAGETKKRVLFLSNIDQVLNFDVQTVHFFPANNEYPPEIVAEKLRIALGKVLVAYDFVAGRLKLNHEIGRLEIDCNGGGIGFVVASSDYSLNAVGDMVYPNPAFAQLIVQKINDLEGHDQQPLCIVQITSFKCGGFAMGVSTNHVLFDGISFKTFIQNLASQSFDDNRPLAVIPCNDRHLLAARSPPRVTFPHPELLKLKLPIGEEPAPTVFSGQSEDLDIKIFRLSSDDVSYLKDKAKEGGATKISSFNVVTAHVWRCKALSCGVSESDMERLSTVLFAVDIRRRVNPPLPAPYTGNAVLTAYATAKCMELKEGPISKLVDMVSNGANRITDEYARSAIDWGELYKGFPHGEFLISSWWKLGFSEVVYSWGKPIYSCPVVYHRKDIILLFPDIEDGLKSNNNNNAVNVLAALPPKEMERFQCLFHELLA